MYEKYTLNVFENFIIHSIIPVPMPAAIKDTQMKL